MCDPMLAGGLMYHRSQKDQARNTREEQWAREDSVRDKTWEREDKLYNERGGSTNTTNGSKPSGSGSGQSNTSNNQTYT